MIIGLSLPFDYLNGANKTASGVCFSEALGKPVDALNELKKHDVNSIELQQFGPGASACDLLESAQSILDSGLKLTLHGYLARDATSHLLDDTYPQLLPLMDYLNEQQVETLMVVHAIETPGVRYQVLLKSTISALQQLSGDIHARDLPIKIALEINRYHGVDSPSTTYVGLLAIAQHLNSTEMGFCWDMGHTQSSIQQHRLAATPPPAFVREVIHTHIHGLSPDGDTHRPLTESYAHIVSGINELRAFGYKGLYNMELYPLRWGSKKTIRSEILGSILRLREILRR